MFDRFKRLWKGIRKMFDYTTLKGIAEQDIALSKKMIEALDGWKQMLDGNASWIMDPVESLRIESGICREFADAVLVEMDTGIQNNDNGLFAFHNQGSIDNCHHFHLLPKDYFGNKKQDILNQCPEFSDHLHHPEVAEPLP